MSQIAAAPQRGRNPSPPFAGFAAPNSNTLYCPNQFFDVCVPNSSRGCVRLVAYLLRKTLGWSDVQGRPQAEFHRVSYGELIRRAGISRDMIRSAIAEAIDAHFITRHELGRPNSRGVSAASSLFELKWDERGEYIKDTRRFAGFFAGEGNRTYIPNQFFDRVIRDETLAVIKVVGSVIRLSIGFQTKWGHRRQQVSLSYRDIARYSRLRDRTTIAAAIRSSLASNYLHRVSEGVFDPHAGRLSQAATYAVKWLNDGMEAQDSQKTRPEKFAKKTQPENPTGNGLKSRPARRSENPTDIQITDLNNTSKQHVDAVAFERLKREGFDARVALQLAAHYPAERIDRQLAWIRHRQIKRNRLGMLRSAIEQDWSAPTRGGDSNLAASVTASEPRDRGTSFHDALRRAQMRLTRAGEAASDPSL